jgi:hypothetical protein
MAAGRPRLPAEVNKVLGTRGKNKSSPLPDSIKARIPFAEWANNPELFTKARMVEETADFLFNVYGIGSFQDRHTLMMLADQMDTYIKARREQDLNPMVVAINNGKTLAPNPYISIANEAMKNAIKIMNELGLTPKSRLNSGPIEGEGPLAKFLKGPMAIE